MEHNIESLNIEIRTRPPTPPHLTHLTKPAHMINNPTRYSIHSIIEHYIKPTKDKSNIINHTHTHTHTPMPMA